MNMYYSLFQDVSYVCVVLSHHWGIFVSNFPKINLFLEALNEDKAPNIEEEKEKIITHYCHDNDIVKLEINEWLTIDS